MILTKSMRGLRHTLRRRTLENRAFWNTRRVDGRAKGNGQPYGATLSKALTAAQRVALISGCSRAEHGWKQASDLFRVVK